MEKQIKVEQFVQEWMNGHEEGTFIKNQHGQVIYSSGPSSLNLTAFFEILLKDYIEAQQALSKAEDKEEVLEPWEFGVDAVFNALTKPKLQPTNSLDELERWLKTYSANSAFYTSDLLTKIKELKTITPKP